MFPNLDKELYLIIDLKRKMRVNYEWGKNDYPKPLGMIKHRQFEIFFQQTTMILYMEVNNGVKSDNREKIQMTR